MDTVLCNLCVQKVWWPNIGLDFVVVVVVMLPLWKITPLYLTEGIKLLYCCLKVVGIWRAMAWTLVFWSPWLRFHIEIWHISKWHSRWKQCPEWADKHFIHFTASPEFNLKDGIVVSVTVELGQSLHLISLMIHQIWTVWIHKNSTDI